MKFWKLMEVAQIFFLKQLSCFSAMKYGSGYLNFNTLNSTSWLCDTARRSSNADIKSIITSTPARTQPGQLAQACQRDILYHTALCSAIKLGEKREKGGREAFTWWALLSWKWPAGGEQWMNEWFALLCLHMQLFLHLLNHLYLNLWHKSLHFYLSHSLPCPSEGGELCGAELPTRVKPQQEVFYAPGRPQRYKQGLTVVRKTTQLFSFCNSKYEKKKKHVFVRTFSRRVY